MASDIRSCLSIIHRIVCDIVLVPGEQKNMENLDYIL